MQIKYSRYCLIAAFIMIATIIKSQNIEIKGTVVDKKSKKVIPGVLVFLKMEGSNSIKGYSQTSPTGIFKINVPKEKNKYRLEFSLLGYATKKLPLANVSEDIKILMEEKAVDIKEVKVRSPKIYKKGDTISYNVARFAQVQDKTIGDVLKKIPGLEVEKNGSIKYNGKPINKFYVEGLDLLEGRYGIATNGIPQQGVSRVEVMQNHQPIKALEDFTFSDNAAINIKLNKGAKQHWIGTAKLGSGFSPFLWNAEILGMRFAARSQSMNTYKTNNTGADVIGETSAFNLIDLLPNSTRYTPNEYMDLSPKQTSAIGKHRLQFNKTHAVSTTHLWKLTKDYELKGQLIYTNNQTDHNSVIGTQHFFDDDTVNIWEEEQAKQHTEALNFGAILTANTKKFYIKNKLESKINWHTTNFDIGGTYPTLQRGKTPNLSVTNTFEMVKRIGKQVISINSHNKFYRQEHQLAIQRAENKQQQDVSNLGFFTNTEVDYGFNLKTLSISVAGGLSILSRQLKHQLFGDFPNIFSQKSYESKFSFVTPYLKSTIEYNSRNFKAKLKIPLNYYYYTYAYDRLNNRANKLLFFPNLSMKYYFTSKLSVRVGAGINQTPIAENLFYEEAILSNYKIIQRGFPQYSYGNSKSLSFGINYKNPIDMLFADASIMRFCNTTTRVIQRDFIDNYTLLSFVSKDRDMNVLQLNFRISKGIDFLNTLFSLNSIYRSSGSEMYQLKKAISYTSDYFAINPSFTAQLAKWSNIEYKFTYGQRTFKTDNQKYKNSLLQTQHELTLNFMPNEQWRMSLSGEHYKNEITPDQFKNLLMMDMGVAYTLKGGVELSLALNNILDEKEYAYTITNDLSSIYSQYKIRSRSLFFSVYFRL